MSRLRLHQLLAVLVLLAAATWVLTGKFSHIGSDRAAADEAAGTAPAPDAAEVDRRTVLVAEPEVLRYSRAIRVAAAPSPTRPRCWPPATAV